MLCINSLINQTIMKKILSLALVLMVAVAAKAQLYVGGSLGLWGESDSKTTQIGIIPEIGYNINEKWSVGVNIGYMYNKVDSEKANTFVIAPYARYNYFKTGIVRLFVDGGLGYNHIDYKDDPYSAWEIGFKPGIALDITEHFGMIAHLGFIGYRDGDDEIKSAIDAGYGIKFSSQDVSLGFIYTF